MDDFIWYVAKGFFLNLTHLDKRMRQSGHYLSESPLTKNTFIELLEKKILGLNVQAAKENIRRFIRDPRELEGWSTEFFFKSIAPDTMHSY